MSTNLITGHDREVLRLNARNSRDRRRLARRLLVGRVAVVLARGYDQGLTGEELITWAVRQGPPSPARHGERVWCTAWRAEVRHQMGSPKSIDALRTEAMRLINRLGWSAICEACGASQDELIEWMRDGAHNDRLTRLICELARQHSQEGGQTMSDQGEGGE